MEWSKGIGLTGKESGGQALIPLRKHLQQFVPYCVSPVIGETLSEAEIRGLEGLDSFFF